MVLSLAVKAPARPYLVLMGGSGAGNHALKDWGLPGMLTWCRELGEAAVVTVGLTRLVYRID